VTSRSGVATRCGGCLKTFGYGSEDTRRRASEESPGRTEREVAGLDARFGKAHDSPIDLHKRDITQVPSGHAPACGQPIWSERAVINELGHSAISCDEPVCRTPGANDLPPAI